MLHIVALAGVLSISFSAVFVRLAAVSPATAAFFRAAYAVPPLAAAWWWVRRADVRAARDRRIAFASGLLLAADLALWHESIALIGAGLGTVVANVQVVFVAAAGWRLYGDRPRPRTWVLIGVVLAGVALTSGLARDDAYGARPVFGVVLGVLAGACYAAFLVVFRRATRSRVPPAGPLLDATLGTAAGALLCAGLDPGFSLVPAWPAHGWLVALALVGQVLGWLLIGAALPRLPALETSVLLLVQPVFSVAWGVLLFTERLSPVQWAGAGIVLAGVGAMTMRPRSRVVG